MNLALEYQGADLISSGRLSDWQNTISPNTDHWYEVRGFYDAVNDNFEKTFSAGKKLVADEIMMSWHGLSVSYDATSGSSRNKDC